MLNLLKANDFDVNFPDILKMLHLSSNNPTAGNLFNLGGFF
jgi:hypothetical protein